MKQSHRSSTRRILVPVDFSPASLQALEYAVDRAKESGATLILLHVIEPILAESRFISPRLRAAKAEARLVNERRLSLLKKRVKIDVPVHAKVMRGNPSTMIIAGAAASEADSIIMGSVGRRKLPRLLLGSVAARVIRDAPCPVTIVRAPRHRKGKQVSEPARDSSHRSAVVLIGPPGSGKTTLARALKERGSLSVIEVGNSLRQEVERRTTLGRKIEPYTSRGALVPLELVLSVVAKTLQEATDDIVLFDGIPRSTAQISPFLNLLVDHGLELRAVIILTLDLRTAMTRLTGRRVCKDCGALFRVPARASSPVTDCERCGGKLIQRPDDSADIVRARFKRFERETMPTIRFFKKAYSGLTWEQSATTLEEQIDRIWRRLERATTTRL